MIKRLLLAVPLALIGAGWFFYLSLPWPVVLRWRNPERTSFMEMRIEQADAAGDSLRIRHSWLPFSKISRNLKRAVLVAEDARFNEHNGIDWEALREEVRYRGDADFSWFSPADLKALFGSLKYYAANRDRVRGRSTLTQQLAKNLYFSESRSITRKLGEFIVARRLELFLPKDRIFEIYLNSVEWGPGVFGAEAAARHYFGKSATSLTTDQAAALAATLPHPLTSNPKLKPGRMSWRKGLILARMGARGPVKTVPLEPQKPDSASAPPVNADTAVSPPDTVIVADTIRPDTIIPDTLKARERAP